MTTLLENLLYGFVILGVCAPYPVRISTEMSHHQNEQWLLEQGESSTDHRLHACQCPKVVGWIPKVGAEVWCSLTVKIY